ncbi:MAG: hypothetical protein AAFN59_03495 [Pseudomonadota bacterium]
MAFAWDYILKPVLILGLCGYFIWTYSHYWQRMLDLRKQLLGVKHTGRDHIILPTPNPDHADHPAFAQYRETFYRDGRVVIKKVLATWAAIIALSFT